MYTVLLLQYTISGSCMENYFAQSSQSQNVLEIYLLVELQAKYS